MIEVNFQPIDMSSNPNKALVLKGEANNKLASKQLNARFDVAQTTRDNARTWSMTDMLSPDAAYSKHVRKIIRERARSEIENNSYARGIVETFVYDIIGPGPKINIYTGNSAIDDKIEKSWVKWCKATDFARKLRTLKYSRVVDGEGLAILSQNVMLRHPVKLDLNLIECDRLTDPSPQIDLKDHSDGIIFDDYGNPIRYKILKDHPGDMLHASWEYDEISERYVIHDYKHIRAEQHRGVSEISSSLQLFNDLRRYTAAVIAAAETAADYAAVIQSASNGEEEDDIADPEEWDLVQLEKRMATVLPKGWSIGQIKSEQPTNTYAAFKREIIAEIARCLGMPYNVAACDSSNHNFASAKLDHRSYERVLKVEQKETERDLDKIFQMFLIELASVDDEVFDFITDNEIEYDFMWEGQAQVDPRDVNSDVAKMQAGMDNLVDYYARRNLDWEHQLEKSKRVQDKMRDMGLISLKQDEVPVEVPVEDVDEDIDDETEENETN